MKNDINQLNPPYALDDPFVSYYLDILSCLAVQMSLHGMLLQIIV